METISERRAIALTGRIELPLTLTPEPTHVQGGKGASWLVDHRHIAVVFDIIALDGVRVLGTGAMRAKQHMTGLFAQEPASQVVIKSGGYLGSLVLRWPSDAVRTRINVPMQTETWACQESTLTLEWAPQQEHGYPIVLVR